MNNLNTNFPIGGALLALGGLIIGSKLLSAKRNNDRIRRAEHIFGSNAIRCQYMPSAETNKVYAMSVSFYNQTHYENYTLISRNKALLQTIQFELRYSNPGAVVETQSDWMIAAARELTMSKIAVYYGTKNGWEYVTTIDTEDEK